MAHFRLLSRFMGRSLMLLLLLLLTSLAARAAEAYACYTPDNTTLTFYCDDLRESRDGTTYDLTTDYNGPGWRKDNTYSSVTQVVFDASFADARPTSTVLWFANMNRLQAFTGMNYLNTENVRDMGRMFVACRLTKLDLRSFNTAMVTNMYYMFSGCEYLTTIFVGSGWTTATVTSSGGMFYYCSKIKGSRGTTYNPNHTDASYAHIDGGTSNPGYLTDPDAPAAYACYTPSDSTLVFYYDTLRESQDGTTYDIFNGGSNPGWYNLKEKVAHVVFDPTFVGARPTSTYNWFSYMTNVLSVTGIQYLNTEEVTNMSGMFMNCNQIEDLDLSGFNTANVTTMSYMFYSCRKLNNLDVSGWNTSSVTNMDYMFNYCNSLESLDLSHFNTADVTIMRYMFVYCYGLKTLDVSSFNTAKVENMMGMFQGCSQLTTIYAGNEWTTEAVTESSYMFSGCTSLVGGQGTVYDADHVDAAYAHIDGGVDNPGYFTGKPGGMRGDVNGDSKVDITDATMLINYLLNSNPTGINMENANCDQQGGIDITDATMLINYLLNGHW
ncbi:MAG: BspA family leucine-rich repeat surface protein [Muribaculaceae bacterium]|nr:BspA family leucine-rich repeat surface protein [Muribaculaceae bacterium]